MYGFKAPLSDTNGSSSATAPAPFKGFHPVLERFKAGGKPALGEAGILLVLKEYRILIALLVTD